MLIQNQMNKYSSKITSKSDGARLEFSRHR